jgi:hypothetical protein
MAGLFFQPQQPDYRGLWGWNPAQTFITAKNELESADLKRAESDRLRKKDEIDEEVSRTLLPLKVREAEANIGLAMARAGEMGARAQYLLGSEGRKLTAQEMRLRAANDPNAVSNGIKVLGGSYFNDGPKEVVVPATGFEDINGATDAEGVNTDFNLGSAVSGKSDNFLTVAAEGFPNPATLLEPDNYAVSSDPQNLSADLSGGVLPPKVTREDAAGIKTMARGPAGAQSTMAKSVDLGESKSPLDEAVNSNPLDDFDVAPGSAMQATLDKNSDAFSGTKKVALPPKSEVAPSLGQTIAGFGQWESSALRKLNRLKQTDPAAYEQGAMALEAEKDRLMGDLGSAYNPLEVDWLMKNAPKADRFVKYKKSGVMSEEAAYLSGMNERQADGILKVFSEGVLPDGSSVPMAVENLDHAKAIYNDALRRGMPATKEGDSLERATKAQTFMDAVLKKPEAERTEEDIMVLERAGADRDSAMGLPQGASKLGGQLNRYFKQNQELEEARNMGLDTYDGVTADQFDTRIAENMNRIQAIAIKNAPSFKNSAERDAWFQNEETKGLPFKMGIGGKTTVVYATGDPNVVTSYVANGKKGPEWVTHSLAQKTQEPEKPAESKGTEAPKVSVSEEIKANLTTASSAKEKLDKMWSGGYAVSPDKAQREEYAATKEELNENLAPVYAQIRKLEQEVRDTGYPNFKGDASLNKERFKQIKELRGQIPLGHRLKKELLGLGKAKAKQAAPQPAPVEEAPDETNPLLQNWEGILNPRTQSIKGMENVGLVKRGLPSKQSAPAAPLAPDESSPWGNILRPRSENIKGMGNVGFLKK